MARQCDICGRGAVKGASRSHSKTKTLRRLRINLQKHEGQKVCTSCIRTKTKRAAAMAA